MLAWVIVDLNALESSAAVLAAMIAYRDMVAVINRAMGRLACWAPDAYEGRGISARTLERLHESVWWASQIPNI